MPKLKALLPSFLQRRLVKAVITRISDDHSSLRFCGFSSSARRKLEECYESSEPVLLSGCEIKKSRQTDGLEILVKTGTEISKLQRSFGISKDNGRL